MKFNLTPRLGYVAGFLISGGLIAYALYLQYYEYQNPCPLCILQRVVYIALMVVFLILGAAAGIMNVVRTAKAMQAQAPLAGKDLPQDVTDDDET